MRYSKPRLQKRDEKGRFIKGQRPSPATEFKPGQHWRPRKPYWDKTWLEREYIENLRPASDIAQEWGITENAILFWLAKHGIPRRTVKEIRAEKHWGSTGEDNPMWKGGITSEREGFLSSLVWAKTIRKIYGRDKKTCQRCHRKQSKRFTRFHIHHRISFKETMLRLNLDNLVLLCAPCHYWVHSKANKRKEFLGSFQSTIEEVMLNGES